MSVEKSIHGLDLYAAHEAYRQQVNRGDVVNSPWLTFRLFFDIDISVDAVAHRLHGWEDQ